MNGLLDWNVRTVAIRDNGLVGTLFLPPSPPPYPAVITLGGSGPGMFSAPGALLASRGIAVLALAYFGVEHLPEHLERIPLEYFGTAIEWCSRRDDLRPKTPAVAGVSRGGELALLVAATYPEIIAVVAWVGSGVIWGGIGGKVDEPVSAWTRSGQDLPFLRFDRKAISQDQRPIRFTPGFIAALSVATIVTAAEIPVELINGPILLISGGDDQVWPSKMLSDIAVQRLRRAQHPFKVEHLCYEGAGHAIGPPHPFAERSSTRFVHPLLGYECELGGLPELNARASKESWEHVVPFLHERFASL